MSPAHLVICTHSKTVDLAHDVALLARMGNFPEALETETTDIDSGGNTLGDRDFGPFMIWASTELWTVIIIGSIPPLRPLFLRLFSKVSSQITPSRGTGARTQNTQDRTGISMSKLNRSALDKKGGISTHSRQIIDIESDGSTENVLANDHLAKGIMVKHDVDIETNPGRPSDVSSGVGRAR
ncbi:hypothetical protein KVT40_008329 [Elsinoe batatas]|uniref:Uncharacterized protein n=1 Tax=Elsinoe batatas TaxID=2601811 RepID=A0A8K0PDQ8_9PEZI|nr:hypothetical protein KVT40_008329 [Elsinoe batatas]